MKVLVSSLGSAYHRRLSRASPNGRFAIITYVLSSDSTPHADFDISTAPRTSNSGGNYDLIVRFPPFATERRSRPKTIGRKATPDLLLSQGRSRLVNAGIGAPLPRLSVQTTGDIEAYDDGVSYPANEAASDNT